MRAILIDPVTKTVSEVDYTGDYRNIYEHIKADCFTVAMYINPDEGIGYREDADALFVDDEGLLVNPNPHGYFRMPGLAYRGTLAGRGLVVGPEVNEQATAARSTLEQIRGAIEFIDHPDPYSIEPTITVTDWNGNPL